MDEPAGLLLRAPREDEETATDSGSSSVQSFEGSRARRSVDNCCTDELGDGVPEVVRDCAQNDRGIRVHVDRSRDSLLTEFGREMLGDRYLLPGESCQDLFARVAMHVADDSDGGSRSARRDRGPAERDTGARACAASRAGQQPRQARCSDPADHDEGLACQ